LNVTDLDVSLEPESYEEPNLTGVIGGGHVGQDRFPGLRLVSHDQSSLTKQDIENLN